MDWAAAGATGAGWPADWLAEGARLALLLGILAALVSRRSRLGGRWPIAAAACLALSALADLLDAAAAEDLLLLSGVAAAALGLLRRPAGGPVPAAPASDPASAPDPAPDLDRLAEARRLEDLGRAAGGIAHDLNNSLAAMVGYASFLTEDLADGTEQNHFAGQIVLAGAKAHALVDRVLALSRSPEPGRRPVDLRALLASSEPLLRAALGRHLDLRMPASACLPEPAPAEPALAVANPTRLAQVLLGLCLAAGRAVGEGPGQVEVALDRVPGEAPRLRLSVAALGAEAARPPGVDPVGLDALRAVAAADGGALEAEPAPGGVRLALLLPEAAPSPRPAAGPAAGPSAPPGRARILLAADGGAGGDRIALVLERLGHEVASCVGAEEALEALGEDAGAFDLVLAALPEAAGLARRAAALCPVPVVAIEGGEPDDARLARAVREALDAGPARGGAPG
jgi:signal transduction histidine kinase/CheY-like chemotaxis protein